MTQNDAVIFFHPYFLKGGAEKTNIQHAKYLLKNNYDVFFASIVFDEDQVRKFEELGIKGIDLKSKRSSLAMFSLFKNINLLLQRYDRVHLISCQNFANCLTSLMAPFLSDRVLTYFFDRNHLIELDINGSFKNKLMKILIPFCYQAADYVITNSVESSTFLETKVHRTVHTVYNPSLEGVLPSHFKKMNNSHIKIGCICRLEKQKNLSLLINAYSELQSSLVSCELIIAGDGSLMHELKELARVRNCLNVSFIGHINNPDEFFEAIDLFVLSSDYEGLPNTLIEALSHAVPSVSTDCPSGPREILIDGTLGPLARTNDKESLIESILRRIENDSYYVENSHKHLLSSLKNFHIDNASGKLLSLIKGQV